MEATAGEGDDKPEEAEKNPGAESAKKAEVTVTDNYVGEAEHCATIDEDDPFVQELKEECEQEVRAAKKEKEDYWEEQLNKVEKGLATPPAEATEESTAAESMAASSSAGMAELKKKGDGKGDVLKKDVLLDAAPQIVK